MTPGSSVTIGHCRTNSELPLGEALEAGRVAERWRDKSDCSGVPENGEAIKERSN